jgi:hypothetical protein
MAMDVSLREMAPIAVDAAACCRRFARGCFDKLSMTVV